jgi:hypothetical protein
LIQRHDNDGPEKRTTPLESVAPTLTMTLDQAWDELTPSTLSVAAPAARYGVHRPPVPDDGARLLERVGSGAHGNAWLVEYLGSKEVRKYVDMGEGTNAMAFREAIHSRRVEHPNVVRVYDVRKAKPDDHADNTYILRMDYIPGKDLSRIVGEEGVLPLDNATIALLLQVIDALACAHDQSVLHLDLKPSNLLMREDRTEVILTDFGISDSVSPGERRTGGVKGTPFFMAPEQTLADTQLGPGADIWGFGVTVYYLLSGRYPFAFEGKDLGALFDVIRAEDPIPLTDVAPWIPESFWAFLAGTLVKDPAKRYASMADVKRKLKTVWRAVVCPACGRSYAEDRYKGQCPNQDCGDNRALPLVTASTTLRMAGRAFAMCQFKDARKLYGKLADSEGADLAAIAAEGRRLGEIVDVWAADHDWIVEDARATLAAGEMVPAFHKAFDASRTYSHSDDLKKLLEEIGQAIKEHYDATDAEVESLIGNTDFESAHRYLEESDRLREDARVRRLIFGEANPEDSGFGYLHRRVESSERQFSGIQTTISEAIAQLDFTGARNALNELQDLFPSIANRERIQSFKNAERTMAFLASFDDALIDEIAQRGRVPEGQTVQLAEARDKARELVQTFSPTQYPSLRSVVEQLDKLEEACLLVKQRAEEWIAQATAKAKEFAFIEASELLEQVADLVLRTDVMPGKFQQEFRQRRIEYNTHIDEAKRAYESGVRCEQERHYRKAIVEFEQAHQLDPRQFPDLSQHLESCRAKAELCTTLRYEAENLFQRVMVPPPHLRDLLAYYGKARRFLELADAETASGLIASIGQGTETWFAHEIEGLRRPKSGEVAAFLRALPEISESIPVDVWHEAVAATPRLHNRVSEACNLVIGFNDVESEESAVMQARVTSVADVAVVLARTRALVSQVPPGNENPCERAAVILEDICKARRASERTDVKMLAEETIQTIETLVPACCDTSAAHLRRIQNGLRAWAQTYAAVHHLRGFGRRSLPYAIPAAAALVGFLLHGAIAPWRTAAARESAIETALASLDGVAAIEPPEVLLDRVDDEAFYSSVLTALGTTWHELEAEPRFPARAVLATSVLDRLEDAFADESARLVPLERRVGALLADSARDWFANLARTSLAPCDEIGRVAARGHENVIAILALADAQLASEDAPAPVEDARRHLGDLRSTLARARDLLDALEDWSRRPGADDPWAAIELYRRTVATDERLAGEEREAVLTLFDNGAANRILGSLDATFRSDDATATAIVSPATAERFARLGELAAGGRLRFSDRPDAEWLDGVVAELGN